MIDRRKDKRYDSRLEMAIYPSGSYEIKLLVRNTDISRGGVRVTIPNELIPESNVVIKCTIPNAAEELTILGDIVWCQRSKSEETLFDAGIKFTSMGELDKKYLYDYVLELEQGLDRPKDKEEAVDVLRDGDKVQDYPPIKSTSFFIILVIAFVIIALILYLLVSRYISRAGIWGIHY